MGAGLGLCGICAYKLSAKYVYITDGDSDTLKSLRSNVKDNVCDDDDDKVSCSQLIWGNHQQYPTRHRIDVILGADIIYVEEMLPSLWDTVSSILAVNGMFILGYTPRNVSVDLVLQYASTYDFAWTTPSSPSSDDSSKGIYVFTRK